MKKSGLLETANNEEMAVIAGLTNPGNIALRDVVESTEPSDVDLEALRKVADDLRVSAALKKSIIGE